MENLHRDQMEAKWGAHQRARVACLLAGFAMEATPRLELLHKISALGGLSYSLVSKAAPAPAPCEFPYPRSTRSSLLETLVLCWVSLGLTSTRQIALLALPSLRPPMTRSLVPNP